MDTLHGLQQRSPVWTRPERCCAWWGYPLEVPQLKIMCCSILFHLRICSTMAITQTDFMINDTYAENTQNRQVILHMTPDVVARCLYRSTCACWPWCGPLQLTLQTCAGWKCRFGRPQDSHTIVYLDIYIYIMYVNCIDKTSYVYIYIYPHDSWQNWSFSQVPVQSHTIANPTYPARERGWYFVPPLTLKKQCANLPDQGL